MITPQKGKQLYASVRSQQSTNSALRRIRKQQYLYTQVTQVIDESKLGSNASISHRLNGDTIAQLYPTALALRRIWCRHGNGQEGLPWGRLVNRGLLLRCLLYTITADVVLISQVYRKHLAASEV